MFPDKDFILHDIPRDVIYDSSVIALAQTFHPVVYNLVGSPGKPEGYPCYPLDTICFYRRLSWPDREVFDKFDEGDRWPIRDDQFCNVEVLVKCQSAGAL